MLARLENVLPHPPAAPDWNASVAFRYRRRSLGFGTAGLLEPVKHVATIRLSDLPPAVRRIPHRYLAACVGPTVEHPFTRWLGDGVVSLESATARDIAGDLRCATIASLHHVNMLQEPRVYAQLKAWLAERRRRRHAEHEGQIGHLEPALREQRGEQALLARDSIIYSSYRLDTRIVSHRG